MATATTAAISHQIPPFTLSPIPRIRPPRILPGTPSPNSKPQPADERPPPGAVWVQGRWRNQTSNAAKNHQAAVGKRVKRALRHHTHGMNIYAYKHVHTSQVVYSLTRIMESRQIMPQLVFHGKQTKPAALRRDMWRPYFSIHFPDSSVGARAGLIAYNSLRNLAMRRQHSAPEAYLIATQEDVEKAKEAAGDPVQVRDLMRERKLKLPMVGRLLPQKLRARKLMDQKATSVADAAYTLAHSLSSFNDLQEKLARTEKEWLSDRFRDVGQKRRRRLRGVYALEAEKAQEITSYQELAENVDLRHGKMPLDPYVAKQLSIEYDGAVGKSNRLNDIADIEAVKGAPTRSAKEIKVLWADIRDGTYAESWPAGVYHGHLQPLVTSKGSKMIIRQKRTVDDDGVVIEEQRALKSTATGSSPHIIGRERAFDYKSLQDVLGEQYNSIKQRSKVEVRKVDAHEQKQNLPLARRNRADAAAEFESLAGKARFINLVDRMEKGLDLTPSERTILADFQERQRTLLSTLASLRSHEKLHPELTEELDRLDFWKLYSGEATVNPKAQDILDRKHQEAITLKELQISDSLRSLEASPTFPDGVRNRVLDMKTILAKIELARSTQDHEDPKSQALGSDQVKAMANEELFRELFTQLQTVALEARTTAAQAIQDLDSQPKPQTDADHATSPSLRDQIIRSLLPGLQSTVEALQDLDELRATTINPLTPPSFERYLHNTQDLRASICDSQAQIANLHAGRPSDADLPTLQALLAENTKTLEALEQEALQDFLTSEWDVNALIPTRYRDDKYWADRAEEIDAGKPETASWQRVSSRAAPPVEQKDRRGWVNRITGGWLGH